MKKRIKLQGFLIFVAAVATLLLSKYLFPHWRRHLWDVVFDAAGICLVILGFLFRIAARGYKEENSQQSKVLVKAGPYTLIRNPMYFGTLLIGIGIICLLFNAWALLLFLGVYLAIYIPQIKNEEATLSERFGKEFHDYCKITPKYLPRLFQLSRIHKYISVKSRWIKREFTSLLPVILVIVAIEVWQDAKLFSYQAALREGFGLIVFVPLFLLAIGWLGKKK